MSNRRTGKIARLPKEFREVVNQMLMDGATYQQVIDKLAEHNFTGISEDNVGNWKTGGFEDWCKEQDRLADMRDKREFALEIVKQNEGSNLHQASLHLAASQIYEALTDFDIGGLKDLMAEKPENFRLIVDSIAKLSQGNLAVEKFKATVRERDERIQKELDGAKSKGGLTPETIEKIERELRLL